MRRPRGKNRGTPIWANVDLREWAAAIIGLPCWTDEQRGWMKEYSFQVREYDQEPRKRWGYCDYGNRVVSVSVWPGRRGYEVIEVLLHELVHAAGHHYHNIEFRGAMLRACLDLTGVDVPMGDRIHDDAYEVQMAVREGWLHLVWTEVQGITQVVVPYGSPRPPKPYAPSVRTWLELV